jgi:hypothetical protein
MSNVTPAELVERYIALRNLRDKIRDEHKDQLEPIVAAMDRLEGVVLDHLRSTGVESMRTAGGTVYYSRRDSFKVVDGPAFFQFVFDNQRSDMLENRAAKEAVNAHLKDTGTLPPGVGVSSEYVVGFRKK